MKVELQNLTKIFPSRNKKSGEEVVAVNNFTFTIPDGKLVGLLGPSGCGKSTILNRLIGQKIAIATNKAQTTRRRINGILTTDE